MFKNQQRHCSTIIALIAISAIIVGSFALRSQLLQPAMAQSTAGQAGQMASKAGQMMSNQTGNQTGNQSGNLVEQVW